MSLTKKPNNHTFASIFNGIAPKYDDICNPYSLARRQEFIQSHAHGRILEVGAATGIICEPLRTTHDVTVCDISPQMCRLSEERGLETICCDAEDMPFEDRTFHTVIATEVLYYLDHPERFIAEAARILKTHGKLLLTLPSPMGRIADGFRHGLRRLGFSHMYFDDGIRKFIPLKKVERLFYQSQFSSIQWGRMILFPRKQFDRINRFLEEVSVLKHLSLFATIVASRN